MGERRRGVPSKPIHLKNYFYTDMIFGSTCSHPNTYTREEEIHLGQKKADKYIKVDIFHLM